MLCVMGAYPDALAAVNAEFAVDLAFRLTLIASVGHRLIQLMQPLHRASSSLTE